MHKRDITIILATSVLPSHPDTRIIDQTISDIRVHFPDNEIIMQIDGLRQEQKSRKKDYDEYKSKILWKCMYEYKNVFPVIFDKHSHQTTMMNHTIDLIDTSLMLYVEGDTPLTPDLPIDWEKCLNMLEYDKANTIRFHFEASIPKEHDYLMLGLEDGFMKTIQWSQRPHLTRVKYYRDVVLPASKYRTFIEDLYHGKVQDDYNSYGEDGWNIHKLWIYHPENNIKRSYHLDGREGGRKYTADDDVWGYKE